MDIDISTLRDYVNGFEKNFEVYHLNKIDRYVDFKDYDLGVKEGVLLLCLYTEDVSDNYGVREFANDFGYKIFAHNKSFLLIGDKVSFFIELR